MSNGVQYPIPKGSSSAEPGMTPKGNLTLKFATWTQFSQECGQSRVDAGLHFPFAVKASGDLCGTFGTSAYEYVLRLVNGTAPLRPPSKGRPVSSIAESYWHSKHAPGKHKDGKHRCHGKHGCRGSKSQ